MIPSAPASGDLKGQLAVVTGGGGGIGAEIAAGLAAAGAVVALVGRNETLLNTAVEEIRTAGGEALALVADVSSEVQVADIGGSLGSRYKGVDLLVNNAGILGETGRWWETPPGDWWRVMEINLKGAMLCVQTFLPGMLARGKGRIVNLASNAGAAPIPGLCPYGVSKAALLRLTDSLSEDLRGTGVKTFAVSPGLVKTDLSRKLPAYDRISQNQWHSSDPIRELCIAIAAGLLDQLSGRYLHAIDDIKALIQEAAQIVTEDLYTLRLRTPTKPYSRM